MAKEKGIKWPPPPERDPRDREIGQEAGKLRAKYLEKGKGGSGAGQRRWVAERLLKLDDNTTVSILELPGLPPKGDIIDWLENGGTKDQFIDLAAKAPLYEDWGMKQSGVVLQSSKKFTDGFVAPNYLVDGLVQRRYLYSATALTGHGKTAVALALAFCVATGTRFGDREVEQGRVLYLAGENADDVRARVIIMADVLGVDLDTLPIHFVDHPFNITDAFDTIANQLKRIGGADLVIIDTAAPFFDGEDENSNVQQGQFARELRGLIKLPGGPCVLVACHPVKNARKGNLLPRGGGAFVNEVDGNLTLWSDDKQTTTLFWQHKLRGPGFEPMTFRLKGGITSDKVMDSKERLIPSVIAEPMTEREIQEQERITLSDEDNLLVTMLHHRGRRRGRGVSRTGQAGRRQARAHRSGQRQPERRGAARRSLSKVHYEGSMADRRRERERTNANPAQARREPGAIPPAWAW